MATKKKMLQAAAGNAGGEALNVEDVFSTYLYTGTNDDGPTPAQTITNGIDLSGEGGMVWIKARDYSANHALVDTVRGNTKYLESSTTSAEKTTSVGITAFNSNGFSLGADNTWQFNTNNAYVSEYASWTFRKAPKFFTCVEYTGTGSAQTIAHNLGTDVGTIIVKRTDSTSDWSVWHRGYGGAGGVLNLNESWAGFTGQNHWNSTLPTSTEFSLGAVNAVNASGGTYVAYLFAHNDGDGGFGPDGDADIIKCGSYTGNGSTTGPVIDLGFEPQWLLIKRASGGTGDWFLVDAMRGLPNGGDYSKPLFPSTSAAENQYGAKIDILPTGFQPRQASLYINDGSSTYIYIAIRRGTKVPESGTEVFDVTTWTSSGEPKFQTSFASDMAMNRNVISSYDMRIASRLTQGNFLRTSTNDVEAGNSNFNFDYMNGFLASGGSSDFYSWMWKRAPNFFDVVAYKGTGSGTQVLNHNLGVAPELVIQKGRSIALNWAVASKITDTTFLYGQLNSSQSLQQITYASDQRYFTNFSDTSITIGNDLNSNDTHIMYLFASLDGISKVGTFATSSDLVVDCGFTAGARFVLVKRVPSALGSWDSWFVFDTERGITASADGFLELNTTDAESTDGNNIEPHSSGFKVKSGGGLNFANGNEFIFYAIA